jgi:hypothetical protein
MAESRRVFIKVEYDGKDISDAVSNSVINLQYIDKASNEADEMTINCHDRDGHWHNDWYPKVRAGDGAKSGDYSKIAKALQEGTSAANLQKLIDETDLTPGQGATLQRVTDSAKWSAFSQQNPQYKGYEGKLKLINDIKAGVVK